MGMPHLVISIYFSHTLAFISRGEDTADEEEGTEKLDEIPAVSSEDDADGDQVEAREREDSPPPPPQAKSVKHCNLIQCK